MNCDRAANEGHPCAPTSPAHALALQWSFFPCDRRKTPLLGSWKPFQVRQPTAGEMALWESWNPACLAVVTGAISRVIVLDFDGEAGRMLIRHLAVRPHVRTGSGGFHLYLRAPNWPVKTLNGKSKKELGGSYPGLDIRAEGGYAIFAGRSEHGAYCWLRGPLPDLPDVIPSDLRELLGLTHPPAASGHHEDSWGKPKVPPSPPPMIRPVHAKSVKVGELVRLALDLAPAGRNNAGFWLACQLRDLGLSQSEALDSMREFASKVPAANSKGQPEPYTETEMLCSHRQAYKRPPRDPIASGAGERAHGAPS